MKISTLKVSTLLLIFLITFHNLYSQNNATPGNVDYYQTINSIGIEWPITGDDNHNAICNVKYRKSNESNWKDGLDLYRIDFNGSNMMAGSILFLEASTSYQVELSLNDADGGNSIQTIEVTTRAVPQMPAGGNTYYVTPGDGGGTGTSDDPFKGIHAAQMNALPGDIFLLKSGTYSSNEDNGKIQFEVSGTAENYIVWKADEGASVILEGARIKCHFIWIEGVLIQNQQYGVLVGSNVPEGIVIKGNSFKGCNYSINLNHGGKNWYITDNVIEGDISDFTSGAMGGEGVELQHSNGHVVAYNKIYNVADGVSYPGKNCDIFRNEIYNVSDDGIEFDYGYANNRAWENRITTANNNGISFQPMNGAPMYVIRNQVIVVDQDALKLRDAVDRALIANNTFVCWNGVMANSTGLLTRFQSNNNLWISVTDRYAWEDNSGTTTTDWRTNLDYDGFDWNNNSLAFKWKGDRLASLEELQTKYDLEANGIRVRKEEIFETYDFPESPTPTPLQYLSLKQNCNAIDAGVALNNINVDFNGVAPDLGAFEYGKDLPVYGPRNKTSTNLDKIANNSIALACYPNPFSQSTEIEFKVNKKDLIDLSIFDLTGKKIATLVKAERVPGLYKLNFNTKGYNLKSGLYLLKLASGSIIKTINIMYMLEK